VNARISSSRCSGLCALLLVSGCYAAEPSKEWPSPPDCSGGCPKGYACNDGVCSGGNPLKLDFDIETFPVSGRLTVNGDALTPTGYCADSFFDNADEHIRMLFETALEPAGWKDVVDWGGHGWGTRAEVSFACDEVDGKFETRLPKGDYRVTARLIPDDYAPLKYQTRPSASALGRNAS
jgi:hypothetical protein